MHLGPLEGLLARLERILTALGGLLDRLEAILSALKAILAENVALTCMERAWNVHGNCMDVTFRMRSEEQCGAMRWAERGEGKHP